MSLRVVVDMSFRDMSDMIEITVKRICHKALTNRELLALHNRDLENDGKMYCSCCKREIEFSRLDENTLEDICEVCSKLL